MRRVRLELEPVCRSHDTCPESTLSPTEPRGRWSTIMTLGIGVYPADIITLPGGGSFSIHLNKQEAILEGTL